MNITGSPDEVYVCKMTKIVAAVSASSCHLAAFVFSENRKVSLSRLRSCDRHGHGGIFRFFAPSEQHVEEVSIRIHL